MSRKRIIYVFSFFVFLMCGVLLHNFVFKEEVKKEETGKYVSVTNDKVMLAFTINGEVVNTEFPQKGEGYIGESVVCDRATGNWNNVTWKLELTGLIGTASCTVNFVVTPTLAEQILIDNPIRSTRSDFSVIFTDSNNGNTIYTAVGEDGDTTYYFAGAVSNNYVLFAGKYWRIVRINEDNSVRLIYAGVSSVDNAAFISIDQQFNTSANSSEYVGYKYTLSSQHGTGTDSAIKTVVDNWYRDNINTTYGNYVSKTAIYCNDRTVGSGSWCDNCGIGFNYSPASMVTSNSNPTFVCSNTSDKFTASTTTGNNTLAYPVGLITAGEVSYAGGLFNSTNRIYYMAQNASSGAQYWGTMSPYDWDSYDRRARVFSVGNGGLYRTYANIFSFGVRPVLSLKACVNWSNGDGTSTSPYEVSVSEECTLAENEVLSDNTVRVSATTNDANIASVQAPASIIKEVGSNHTFTFNVTDGYEYKGVENCNGVYDTATNTLMVTNIQESTSCKVNFVEPTTLAEQILIDNPTRSTRSDFATVFNTSNNGNTIYRAAGQDGGTTYYFAGAVSNNYVLFAGKYWRIVRINEDNSVRLIYAGTSASDTAAFISTSQAFNTSRDNSAHVGYKYTLSSQHGTGTNSGVKTVVDNWYRDNINASYGSYVSKTAIYCNDRTVGSGTWSATGVKFYYSGSVRLNTNKTPTLTCSNAADKFTASTTTGNNALIYPVGLITADEISYAGGLWGTNNATYYITQNTSTGVEYWWTMSPLYWDNFLTGLRAYEFVVAGSSDTGRLLGNSVDTAHGVRPVLSLKSCVNWSAGSGTATSPYQVSVGTACAAAEN